MKTRELLTNAIARRRALAHVITTAYYWSVEQMRHMLSESGFDVLDVPTRQDSNRRPHAAIAAVVPGKGPA